MRYIIILILSLFPLSGLTSGQQTGSAPPNPCAASEQRQLDFWVGEWDLTWPGNKAGEVQHGTNSIRRVLDGCVVEENFSGESDMHLRGKSVSIFDTNSGKWKQTWADNEGGYLDFMGEFKDGQMILGREVTRPDGTKGTQRMVFKNIGADEFDWSWDGSKDGGKTWQVVWPIHYKRRKQALVFGKNLRLVSGPENLSDMTTRVDRRTVDLSGFPDLVVIYLGMRVNRLTGHQDAARIRSADLFLCGSTARRAARARDDRLFPLSDTRRHAAIPA